VRARRRSGQARRRDIGLARRMIRAAALALVLAVAAPAPAYAATADDLATSYRQAVRAHDAPLAAHLRTEVRLMNVAAPSPQLAKLSLTLEQTRNEFRPWPLATEVADQAAKIKGTVPFKFDGINEALKGALSPDR